MNSGAKKFGCSRSKCISFNGIFCQSSISTQLADYSDSTCIVKVMAYDLDSVTSFQGTIVLHDSLLLDSITTDLLSLNYIEVSQNTVTYSWFDSSLEGFNFSDSTSLFQLHCKNLAANLCDTLLSFIEIPTEIEVTRNLESINVTHSALISECNYDSTTAFFLRKPLWITFLIQLMWEIVLSIMLILSLTFFLDILI